MAERIGVRGAELAVESSGDAARPAFFWGHGFSSSRAHEDGMGLLRWSVLADTAYVVRYDARGHGESSATPDPDDYRWDELGLDLLALADALECERLAAGGVSMGTATALHAAVRAPERFRALILAAPPTAWSTRAAQAGMYERMAAVVESQGVEAMLEQAAKQPPPPIFAELPEPPSFSPQIPSADLPTVLRGAARSDLPAPEELRAVRVPTLILAWDTDPGHPVSTAEALAEHLPDTRLHIARGVAELATWSARARDFLRESSS